MTRDRRRRAPQFDRARERGGWCPKRIGLAVAASLVIRAAYERPSLSSAVASARLGAESTSIPRSSQPRLQAIIQDHVTGRSSYGGVRSTPAVAYARLRVVSPNRRL